MIYWVMVFACFGATMAEEWTLAMVALSWLFAREEIVSPLSNLWSQHKNADRDAK